MCMPQAAHAYDNSSAGKHWHLSFAYLQSSYRFKARVVTQLSAPDRNLLLIVGGCGRVEELQGKGCQTMTMWC